MKTEEPNTRHKKHQPSHVNSFLKYTSLGLQLLLTLAAAGGLGYFIDTRIGWQFPGFLLLFLMIALAGSIYLLIKQTNE